jgi:hypothetical protein
MTNRILLAAMAIALLGADDADAGLRLSAWSFDTNTVPERHVELEQWITQNISGDDGMTGSTTFLWAPIVGVTDQIEVALPVTATHSRALGTTQFETFGLEARWRLVPRDRDPLIRRKIVPLLRAGVRRLVADDDAVRISGHAVVGFDPTPEIHVVVNAGVATLTDPETIVIEYSAGATYAVTPDVRLGIDAFGDYAAVTPAAKQGRFSVGPAIALTHGRFWVAASVPIGLTSKSADAIPRLIWAIAF